MTENASHSLIPEQLLTFYLEKLAVEEVSAKQLTEKQRPSFVELLKDFQFTVTKTSPLEKSFATGDEISPKEVTPKAMESKSVSGLFFAGEFLGINGYTGGHNVAAAFVTGHVAGSHAAEIAEYTYLPIEEVQTKSR